jgi:cytochrome c oxidase cbb3-type subunit 3
MSDFVNDFWNLYVIVIVVGAIIACFLMLWGQASAKFTPGKTTGHAWDETLEEYSNPLPKWWCWLFLITLVFAIGYFIYFPGLGSFKGIGGWTSHGQYDQEVAAVAKQYEPLFEKYRGIEVADLAKDPQAMETGKRLFMTYCIQCHGADAKGSKGFPNLTDADWLYGGTPEIITETITDGRQGTMTPHKDLLTDAQIKDTANYVRSLSGLPHDSAAAERGKDIFLNVSDCTTCHGADGKGSYLGYAAGNPALSYYLGAPNLTDDVWLYGSSEKTIEETIREGRTARMPNWGKFLGNDKVHILAAYVYSLSHK